MPEQLFSTAEVADACGVSFRRLDHWIRKGYVRVEQQADGSGTKRRFTFGEAMQVGLTAALARVGVRPGTVRGEEMELGMAEMEVGMFPRLPVVARVCWDSEALQLQLRRNLGIEEVS